MRSATFLIETSDEKDPNEKTYGSREIISGANGDYQVTRSSIEDRSESNGYDGHINRNIRLAITMIDMAKPYIKVTSVEKAEGLDQEQ